MTTLLVSWWADVALAAWFLGAAIVLLMLSGSWLSVIDWREHRLPNRIVAPTFVLATLLLGLAVSVSGEWARLLTGFGAALALFGAFFVFRFLSPTALGFGDVKLAALLGLYLGFVSLNTILEALVVMFVLAGLVAAVLLLLRRAHARTEIAFGPYMILGTWLSLLLG